MKRTPRQQAALFAAFKFFREWAGYCVPPGRAACALRLAQAEEWLCRQVSAGRYRIVWELEADPDTSWMDQEHVSERERKAFKARLRSGEETIECCLLQKYDKRQRRWVVVQCLGNIDLIHDEAGRAYRRVVESELALEQME